MVSLVINSDDQESVRMNIKLTKGREYRCLFVTERKFKNNDTLEDEKTYISSVTIYGVKKTSSFCDVFVASSEDMDIQVDGYFEDSSITGGELFDAEGENLDKLQDHISKYVCVVESAGFVDQTVKIDGDNLALAGYIDYQIPVLNNEDESGFNFTNPDSFYYTEWHDDISNRGQRQQFLINEDNSNGLMYDGPMPASVKYIYPRCEVENMLSFYISKEFWKGFVDRFEPENEYASKANNTKPTNINFTLDKLVDKKWEAVTSDGEPVSLSASPGKWAVVHNGANIGETYRLAVVNEEVEYFDEQGDRQTFSKG